MSLDLINRVVELTNIERAKAGLQPLTLNLQLADAAQDHSNDMAKDDFFSHTGADGSTVATRVRASGYEYANAGENIAVGQTTAEQVVESWMNSPGHRANILNENFTEIGIGYTYLENDTGSVNYNHYWTQVFGKPLNNNSGNVTPNPVPESNTDSVEEIANVQQSNPTEDSDSNDNTNLNRLLAPRQSKSDLETKEPVLIEEVEESVSSEEINNEDITNKVDDRQLNLSPEPKLDVEEIGSGEQSNLIEDSGDRGLDLDELSALEVEHTGDLSGESADSVLTGGDAMNSFVYVETSTYADESIRFDYLQEQSKSWLGTATETQTDYNSLDLFEYDFSSKWTEKKQSILQQIAESFL